MHNIPVQDIDVVSSACRPTQLHGRSNLIIGSIFCARRSVTLEGVAWRCPSISVL